MKGKLRLALIHFVFVSTAVISACNSGGPGPSSGPGSGSPSPLKRGLGGLSQKETEQCVESARAKYGQGDSKGAIIDLDRALENFASADSLNLRGLARGKLGMNKEAIADFDAAIKIAPTFGKAYAHRGAIKGVTGQFEEALKDLDRAIELEPNYAKAHLNRGLIKANQGRFKEGLADLNRVIELDSKNAAGYRMRAQIKEKLGDAEGAKADQALAEKLK